VNREKIKFIILRTLGNFFFLFSLWGMAMTFGPALQIEIFYRINNARNVRYVVAYQGNNPPENLNLPTPTPIPAANGESTLFGQITGGNRTENILPVSSQFGIVIPKIGANAPIIPNIDPGKHNEYLPALQKGVAHAIGTVFPGIEGNIYLFAHSTDSFWNVGRYNAVFYLIKELENGDEIDIFYNGIRHVYRVVNKMVIEASEVHYLTSGSGTEQLTLQTCWPPGTAWKRLIVIAKPESDILMK